MNSICIYGVNQETNTEGVIRAANQKGLKCTTVYDESGVLNHYRVSTPSINFSYNDALDLVIYFKDVPGVTDIKIQKKHETVNSILRY